ncbi:MAG: class A beta-lactamase-related serine hydrolase [Gemmatimonadetes bacterium]|nr:class A beta-lactamase-related serine hydrolase [Gemmatimonadota bacterium]
MRHRPAGVDRGHRRPSARAREIGVSCAEDTDSVGPRLHRFADSLVAVRPKLPGLILYVRDGASGRRWRIASGWSDTVRRVRLDPNQPLRIASNTETYVAAAMLRLVERGTLTLSNPLSRHLPAHLNAMLVADGYPTDRMTIEQVFSHRSGLDEHPAIASCAAVADRATEGLHQRHQYDEVGRPHRGPLSLDQHARGHQDNPDGSERKRGPASPDPLPQDCRHHQRNDPFERSHRSALSLDVGAGRRGLARRHHRLVARVDDLAALDLDPAVPNHDVHLGDVVEALVGVAVQDQHIGELADLEGPELVSHVEHLGIDPGGNAEHLGHGIANPDEVPHLFVVGPREVPEPVDHQIGADA